MIPKPFDVTTADCNPGPNVKELKAKLIRMRISSPFSPVEVNPLVQAGDAPRWASRGIYAATAEPWSANLAAPRHNEDGDLL